jgi:hypothetical protein
MIRIPRLFRRKEPDWNRSDLLDHPDLRRMSERELADLPMPRIEAPGSAKPDSDARRTESGQTRRVSFRR